MISIVIISKDERALDGTLTAVRAQAARLGEQVEVVVVDASDGRLDDIREAHGPAVRWIQYERPPGVRVTIPHQRNVGVRAARGDIIVFTDSGCYPDEEWLARLIAPIREGEHAAAGRALASADGVDPYRNKEMLHLTPDGYVTECPTINMAFRRSAFDAIGGFDEQFAYGSDSDFSWRLVDSGFRIRAVPHSVIRHDWGTGRRQLRRSYLYGQARCRLYRKHKARRRHILRNDPVVVAYPLFIVGLPITFIFPLYPFLLLIPAWRNRSLGIGRVLADHLALGWGVLVELVSAVSRGA